ncbi:MAG: hypothetical protein AAFN74_21620 [Myxococcota bacterium]
MKKMLCLLPALAFAIACGGAEGSFDEQALDQNAEVVQSSLTESDCFDAFDDCQDNCSRFDFSCRRACIDELSDCLGGGGSSSCSRSSSVNGTTLKASCQDGDCTCEVNGNVVGTCSDDSCDLDSGCCAQFF